MGFVRDEDVLLGKKSSKPSQVAVGGLLRCVVSLLFGGDGECWYSLSYSTGVPPVMVTMTDVWSLVWPHMVESSSLYIVGYSWRDWSRLTVIPFYTNDGDRRLCGAWPTCV